MSKKKLFEGLDYLDLENQIEPKVTVDEYEAKMGENSDIITLSFVVRTQEAGVDLSDWFEGGYDFVLDAQVSIGEVEKNKFLVFVEMARRTSTPKRIIELLNDLRTLTGLKLKDWEVIINDESYDANEDILKQVIVLSPHQYRIKIEKQEDLNEMRDIAGLHTKNSQEYINTDLKDFISKAGL